MASCRPANTIYIDKEVSVISSCPVDLSKDNSISTMHSKSSSAIHNLSLRGEMWKSENGTTSSTSRSESMVYDDLRRKDAMESNNESMRALVEFLRTKVPPPENFMSIPESDEMSMKRSPLKIFGRRKRKRQYPPKLLQLPDSAVSAKTTSGARHIAISIPIEYDYLEEKISPLRQHPVDRTKRFSPASGGVVVIKPNVSLPPVHEIRESRSQTVLSDNQDKRDSRNSIPEPTTTPLAELMDTERFKTLEKCHSPMQLSDLKNSNAERFEDQKLYATASTNDTSKRNSQRSHDNRHSGGTTYSATSVYTHSRNRSSISIAPSIARAQSSSRSFPPRTSSVSNIHFHPAQTFGSILNPEIDGVLQHPVYSHSKAVSSVSSYSTTPAFFGTAEVAKSYKPIVPSPAPTRNLPKLPGNRIRIRADSPCVPHFMPHPSPPPYVNRLATHLKRTGAVKNKRDETMAEVRQTRQERVKARKEKDMAALRENTKRIALSDISRETSPERRPSSAPHLPVKSGKRRVVSKIKLHRANDSSLSNIMVVAESSPFTGYVQISDLALPSTKRQSLKRSNNSTSGATITTLEHYTPPQSMASAFGSDSETLPQLPSRREARLSASSPSCRSALDARREERRSRRNLSLQDKELDARLTRIENDNELLLNTLSGIAKSFGGLSMILSQRQADGRAIYEQTKRRERSLEPVKREEQVAAGRASREVTSEGNESYGDEFDVDSDGIWAT